METARLIRKNTKKKYSEKEIKGAAGIGFSFFFFSLDCNFHFYLCLDFQRIWIHIE
tara:strand:- start:335 stop:502 length:168 start_codon:yes stop_codon:yes gene_type:complete